MDKGKIFRLVLIPIVAGLILTLLMQRMMTAPQATSSAAQKLETVPVVVVASKEPVPARTKLLESQVAIRQIPRDLATGSEFDDVKNVVGKIAMIELQPGEVVRQQRIVEEGQGTLPYRIPEGKRAFTLRMDELNGVAGHPAVGDLIDLILFLPEKKSENTIRPASSRILMEGVPVLDKGLAIPVGTTPKQQQGEVKLTSVTVAVSPEQAAELALVEQVGYIKMVLRPALTQKDAGPNINWETKYNPAPTSGSAPAPAQTGR